MVESHQGIYIHVYIHLLSAFSFCLPALGLPGQVGEVCPLIPNLEKCLEEIMELAESGMRYTQMPHVMEVRRVPWVHLMSSHSLNPPCEEPECLVQWKSPAFDLLDFLNGH